MPSLADLGFSKSNRKDYTDVDSQLVETNQVFSSNGISGQKIESLKVNKLKAGQLQIGEFIESEDFVSGSTGFQIDGDGDAEFQNITARGAIKTATFIKDAISSIAGSFQVNQSSDAIAEDITATTTTITTRGDVTLAVGDILRIKDGLDDEWFKVTAIGSAPTYTVIRDFSLDNAIDTSNIVGAWSFDEGSGSTAIDTKGTNNGTITAAVYTTGHQGTALTFNATTSIVTITDNAAIQNIFDGGGTISVWVKPVSIGENSLGRIVDKFGGWRMYTSGNTSTTVGMVFDQAFSTTAGTWTIPSTSLTKNAWNHVALVYNNGSTANAPVIYVNGVSISVTTSTAPVGTRTTDAGTNFFIGNRAATDRTFDGDIDEVRLYTSALTANQVASVAAAAESPAWTKGATVVNYGQSGDGGLLLTASESNAPYMSVFTHAGKPWNATTTRLRVGNLNGYLGYVADTYGFGVGDSSGTNANLTIDPTNGIRIRQGTTNVIVLDNAGNASFSGAITATSGTIGGFSLGADYIRDAANSFGLASTVSGSDDVRFWAGAAFADRATAPFRVYESGVTFTTTTPIQTYTPSAAGTATLDLKTGNDHRITMPAGNITVALSNVTVGQKFLISLTQDSIGSRTVTWFSTIRWADGITPTLTTTASKRDTFGFICTGSGTYDAFILGLNI